MNIEMNQSMKIINLFKYNYCTPFGNTINSLQIADHADKIEPSFQVSQLKDMGRNLSTVWNSIKRNLQRESVSREVMDETENMVENLLASAKEVQVKLSCSSDFDNIFLDHGDLGEYEHTLLTKHRDEIAALTNLSSFHRKLFSSVKLPIVSNDKIAEEVKVETKMDQLKRLSELKKVQDSIPKHNHMHRYDNGALGFSEQLNPSSDPPIKVPLTEYQVPWHIVNSRCRTVPIDHKGEAKRRGLPPPPMVPINSLQENNHESDKKDHHHHAQGGSDVNAVIIVPTKSEIPRIDMRGFKEQEEKMNKKKMKENNTLKKVNEKIVNKTKDRPLGFNLEAHATYGRTKMNFIKQTSQQKNRNYVDKKDNERTSIPFTMAPLVGQPSLLGSIASLETRPEPIAEATASNKMRYSSNLFCLEKQLMSAPAQTAVN